MYYNFWYTFVSSGQFTLISTAVRVSFSAVMLLKMHRVCKNTSPFLLQGFVFRTFAERKLRGHVVYVSIMYTDKCVCILIFIKIRF